MNIAYPTGYSAKCPNCKHIGVIGGDHNPTNEDVECENCGNIFTIDEFEHL